MSGNAPKAAAAALAIALAWGCISHKATRTVDELRVAEVAARDVRPPQCSAMNWSEGNQIQTSVAALRAAGPAGENARAAAACVSTEIHAPSTSTRLGLPHQGFYLHVLEFDDEGRVWNRVEQEATFAALETELQQPAVVVAFVHGWKNDAGVCNGNISCFRDVLEIVSKGETEFARRTGGVARRVIGVYVAWRGGTIAAPGIKNVTFWGRKHTAHTIGDNGAVTAAIARVRTIVGDAEASRFEQRPKDSLLAKTSVVWIGHSFGAALLYSALGTSLNAQVGEALQPAPKGPGPVASQLECRSDATGICVPTVGDLVVLVNPAMEASRFANLHQANIQRIGGRPFKPEQLPIFITLASENDTAVGRFFPIGQAFSTVARAARSRDIWFSMEKGFGMYEPFHTHRLVLKPGNDIPQRDASKAGGDCECPSRLGDYGDALVLRLGALYERLERATSPALAELKLAEYQEMLYTRFEPVRDIDPNNPFLMVSVDPAVVGSHTDIFNPRFMDFLIEYVLKIEIKRLEAREVTVKMSR